jgi:hypothetical protein
MIDVDSVDGQPCGNCEGSHRGRVRAARQRAGDSGASWRKVAASKKICDQRVDRQEARVDGHRRSVQRGEERREASEVVLATTLAARVLLGCDRLEVKANEANTQKECDAC